MEMSLFECDVYFAQSSQLCGYYLRVASNRRNMVHALSKRFTFTCSWYWYGRFSFSFHQKLSYRIPTAALAVPPIAFSHSSGQLYTKKDHTTQDIYHPDDTCTYTLSCTLLIPSLYQYINPIPHWPYFDPPNQSKNISPAWIEPWASSAEESKVGEK